MGFRLLPVLAAVREIYAIPRGRSRLDAYLARMCDAAGDLRLPLTALNPMAKEPTVAVLDALLVLDAENIRRRRCTRMRLHAARRAARRRLRARTPRSARRGRAVTGNDAASASRARDE
jgi:hypothetical protein